MKKFFILLIFLPLAARLRAQNQLAANLQQQFLSYQQQSLQEKLFVHTDKTFYLAGEIIWCKVYAVDASFHKPIDLSRITYIEIIGKDQKPVLQSKIGMISGFGNGSLTLPASLPTGNYLLRAYTNWMKNFPPEFYFEQTISVVNTIRGLMPAPPAKPVCTIGFFAEGGNLVAEIPAKIGFKSMCGNAGTGCFGAVVNQHNDTVAHFQSQYKGMGNFSFTPQRNEHYRAVVHSADTVFTQTLPDVSEQGFALALSDVDSGNIRITVRTGSTHSNEAVYLFVHTRQQVKSVMSAVLKSGETEFLVDKSKLGDGISSFTVFNANREPVCERLFFKRPTHTLQVTALADQQQYGNRKKVTLTVNAGDQSMQPVAANCSVSVFLIDSLQTIPEMNIEYYFFLCSDLRGTIESPAYYFEGNPSDAAAAADNLLLTQGWRRFNWSDALHTGKPAFEFLPEIEGAIINGKASEKKTGAPRANLEAYLAVPGNHFAFSNASSHTDGSIRFNFPAVYKNNLIILQNANPADSNYRIDISNPYAEKFSPTIPPAIQIPVTREPALTSRSTNAQVENTFQADKKRQFFPSYEKDSTAFYGQPDRLYYLEDYTRFGTMEEVMREYVEDVRVRKDGDKFRFRVRNLLFNTFFDDDPLILLDGIPVSDASRIMSLDPLKIKKIEVISHRYYAGTAAVDGIVSIRSYSGDIGATQLDPNTIAVEYDGLQQQRVFYSPSYETRELAQTPMPDFRNLLYWSPDIHTMRDGKAQCSFFTSDVRGKFVVIIQGITADGLPGAGISRLEVSGNQ